MTIPRAHRTTVRALLSAVAGMALLTAGCGSGGGDGTATLPGGSLVPGISVPDDVSITQPPAESVEGGATPTPEPEAPEPEAPVTEAPEPEAPEPEAPVTEAPVTEVAEPEPGPATDPIVGVDAEDAESDGEIWPWVLGTVVVLAIAIGAIMLMRGVRKGSAWEATALTAIADADALTAHLLALEQAGISVAARDDARRLAELVVTVENLVASAPDEGSRRTIDRLRQPLAGLHAAVDAVSMSPTVTPDQLAVVHQWAQQLHVATSTADAEFARRRSVS